MKTHLFSCSVTSKPPVSWFSNNCSCRKQSSCDSPGSVRRPLESGGARSVQQSADVTQPRMVRAAGALLRLNLLHNPYRWGRRSPRTSPLLSTCMWSPLVSSRCVGSTPEFHGLVRLRRLAFGGPALEEIKMAALSGVTELETLTVHANNLSRFNLSGAWFRRLEWLLSRFSFSLISRGIIHGPWWKESDTLRGLVLMSVCDLIQIESI